MGHSVLVQVALILLIGTMTQWIAWRLKIPSILLLLLAGIFMGPVTGIMDVDSLLGEKLFPLVSLSVAIILFEGGLSLNFRDIKGRGNTVRDLISVGVLVTWVLGSLGAYFILGLNEQISLLIGATLVVTGPTVIIPLLNQIRPVRDVGNVLRWEGIIIDPVGATLALLVFEEILLGDLTRGIFVGLLILLQTLLIGGILGWVVAQLMIVLYSRFLVPEYLINPLTLAFVVAAFSISDILQAESGLLTVTVMGIVMANQRRLDIKPIVEFKEALQVLLLSALFIVLSARMTREDLAYIGLPVILFVAFLILFVRPLAVWLATIGKSWNWREKLFVAWMAPRGIVAAAVASVFSIELMGHGYPEANVMVPITFSVIIGTVAVYSLTSGLLARRLGLAQLDPQGLVVVGAHDWGRALAHEIHSAGYRVVMTDTNNTHCIDAEMLGLETYHCNVLSHVARDAINFAGTGRVLAITPNDETNTLVSLDFREMFGRRGTFQLRSNNPENTLKQVPTDLGGRPLFADGMTYDYLEHLYEGGSRFFTIPVDNVKDIENRIAKGMIPLFVITSDGDLLIWTDNDPPRLRQGYQLIALVQPELALME